MCCKLSSKRLNTLSTQKGIVLLAAILVVVVATAIIVSITHSEAFSIRKTARIQASDRANLYALALEDWARLILLDDSTNSTGDNLEEDWATPIPGLPIEGGFLTGYMIDEQAKININDIPASAETLNRFMRLCDNLGIDHTLFIDALIDWIDANPDITYPNGHEYSYETYRVANRPLSDISELMLIKNMDRDKYQKLRPYISALPAPTNINVNTMSKEVFLSLGNGLDDDAFANERDLGAFSDTNDFITRLQLTIPNVGFSVSTDYFYAHGTVVQGDLSVNFNTLIHRASNGSTTILNRSLGRV